MTSSSQQPAFATTRWSLVASAGQASAQGSREALAALCEAYWYPLYAYVRRKGLQPAEAQDVTQAFFTELLEKERIQLADQQRGKFRSFLLAALNHFLANRWRAAQAQKRGGGQAILSLDFHAGESRYDCEPAYDLTAERIFERRWAMTLLDNALTRLREEHVRGGKSELFELLKGHLGLGDSAPYRELAERLGMTEGAVKVAAHRLRRRCAEILREEIAQTVSDPAEIDDELRALFSVVEA